MRKKYSQWVGLWLIHIMLKFMLGTAHCKGFRNHQNALQNLALLSSHKIPTHGKKGKHGLFYKNYQHRIWLRFVTKNWYMS